MRRLSFAEMQAMQADPLGFAARMAREEGGVAHLKILGTELFLVSEPAMIRELLLHHAQHMHRDPFAGRVFQRFMGDGVFMAEGKSWQRQRKLVQPAFHAMRIRSYVDTMAGYTREMVAGWKAGEVKAVDVELTRLTLRIIAKTMYDVDLVAETTRLGALMKEVLMVGEEQLKMLFLPPAWLPTPQNRRQQRALREIRTRLGTIVDERLRTGADHGDLLSMLLAERDETGTPMSREQVLDECITLFVAGHETTAAALTWTWYLLSRHPHIAAELVQQVQQTLGTEPVSMESLARMPLLEAVIKESLRLYPPAFAFGRQVMEPFSANGVDYPKKAVILFSVYATHRRADLWEDPEAFRPARFLDPENHPDRYTYLPFGAGSRICLGNMFAMLEAQVVLATMLQHVWLVRADDAPIERDTLITLRPRDPLYMIVQPGAEPHAPVGEPRAETVEIS